MHPFFRSFFDWFFIVDNSREVVTSWNRVTETTYCTCTVCHRASKACIHISQTQLNSTRSGSVCSLQFSLSHDDDSMIFRLLPSGTSEIFRYLFSPLGKLADRAIYFTFRNLSQIISRSTGFSRFFSPIERYLREFDRSWPFFWFLKGRCHGNWSWENFAKWPSFNTLAFRNVFEYRNSDLHLLNGNIFSSFCAILVKIGH